MALYDGVAKVRLEGDEARAFELIPEGQLLLQKAQAFTKAADVPVFSMSRRVSDDEYLYVLIAGPVQVISISAGVTVPDVVTTTLREPEYAPAFPNFLSGIVLNGEIEQRKRKLADGTEVTYNVLKSFAPTPSCAKLRKLSTGRQASKRLVVRPNERFPEWVSKYERDFSQYVEPRASMWTGMMKKVVQLVMGYGQLSKKEGAPGVQVVYDYKFVRTHGITRGADGRLWLVEVGIGRGVVAMLLPIYPESETPKFQKAVLRRKDTAMQKVIDEFGCLPTGQGFPTGPAYAKALAAGTILQLATREEILPFYRWSGYSSICGWAFSDDGSEAHNVGYGYPDDEFQRGVWYQLNIKIGAINKKRKKNEPLAVGSAALVKQSEGYLYSPRTRKPSYIPVKYHEPLLPGLLSHSAKPLDSTAYVVDCDTVVFVGFMNGELKTCRYFRLGQQSSFGKYTDDRGPGECLVAGSWTWTATTGVTSLPAMPYTNDIDTRSVLEDHFTTSTLTSVDVGYNPPQFTDFLEAPDFCYIWRLKFFRQTVVSEERGGEYRGACFVVPQYSREAYYYFEGHMYNGGRKGSISYAYGTVMDPNTGYGWRKFPRIASIALPEGFDCRIDRCGGKHTERRVICTVFEKSTEIGGHFDAMPGITECRSFADSGTWMSVCQDVVSLCSAKQPRRTLPLNKYWDKGHDFSGNCHCYSDGQNGPVVTPITEDQFIYAMTPSPDPETELIQFISAGHSTLGEDCVIYQPGFFRPYVVTGYVPSPLGERDGMPTFIGVNQA